MISMSKSKAEPRALPQRFYTQVAVADVAGGFAITLDGKPVKTPAGKPLAVPRHVVAEAMAAEWEAQTTVINTDSMPLTRLASIAIDRVSLDRAALLADITNYLTTDLLCYRVPPHHSETPLITHDAILRTRQDAAFDPILVWVRETYGAEFAVTEGVMPIAQAPATLAKIAALFEEATDGELAALAMMVPMLGSALLALALWKGPVEVEAALTMARLDEDFQAEQWGHDPLATEAWNAKCRDIRAAVFFLDRQAP